jgi:hypothetical protein
MPMPLPADARWAHAAAALMQRPLTGYQRDALAALSQPDLAGTGYAHPTAVVVWPRQTGKTTSLFTLALARMMHRHGYAGAYTAQTGHTVTERFSDPGGWLDQVERSPLAARHASRRSQGTERVTNTRTGAYLKAFPPRPGKLRSNALDLVILDECQEHDWELGRTLDADVGPVFTTRPLRQLIYAGTASGPGWWRSKVDQARAGGGLLVEVGTWPDDADPADPAVWRAHHPGLRVGLTDERHLAQQLETLGPQTCAREYGNRWDDDATGDAPVPISAWQACTTATAGEPTAVAFDVTPDRSWCSIVGVTSTRSVRLLHTGPADTLTDQLARLADDHPVVCTPYQAGTASDLRARDVTAVPLSHPDYAAACQVFHDAVVRGDVHHDHQAQLLDALGWAGRSWRGDSWVLSARASGGDITAAAAAVCAWWAGRTADALIT